MKRLIVKMAMKYIANDTAMLRAIDPAVLAVIKVFLNHNFNAQTRKWKTVDVDYHPGNYWAK